MEKIIIDGKEYEVVSIEPGVGFKSKEEEEKFIESIFNYDEECELNINNIPNVGLRA